MPLPHGIDLPTFAAISADLAEGDRPFAEVLVTWKLDETRWTEASVHWGERMGEHAIAFSEDFARAQDAKRPLVQLSVKEWYELDRAIDADGLGKALAQRALGLADYSRLIRHWAREVAANPDVRRELDTLGNLAAAV